MRHRLSLLTLLLLATSAWATTWEIDPAHTSVQFSIRHLMISNVRGEFRQVSGKIEADDKDLGHSSIDVVIQATSVDTQNEKRDGHLRTADFLDVEKFPTITFKSKRITAAGEGKWAVVGDLTLHGVTREITLEVEGPTPEISFSGTVRRGGHATTKINRQDFGVSWNKALEGGGAVVGNEVSITIEVEATKSPAN